MMGLMGATRSVLTLTGRVTNDVVSFIVFTFLDLLDVLLCVLYKLTDLLIEAEWKPCYCSSAKEAITSSGKILVSEQGESKIVCLSSSKLQWEDISDTLYSRPSLVSDLSKSTVKELKRLKVEATTTIRTRDKIIKNGTVRSTFTINSTIVEMLQGKIGGHRSHPIPRWSDCDCITCTSWSSSSSCKETLFVRAEGPKEIAEKRETEEDVIFIHGFISSSKFWTETLFPNFSREAKSKYRLIAVDLLGFGRSPKPTDSLYTLREHVEMIQRSVLEPYKVKSFHIVAHSLGCILALALAVKHPGAVKSLTLLAPGEAATQYVLRKVAPRRVWPPIAFGASIACWYEHISRTICLLICKNHRLWEFLTKLVTRNRLRTYMMEGFFCHTHNAAWHTLHNIICGSAGKVNEYLDTVRDRLNCNVTIFHGSDDELLPVDCSYAVQTRIPRARVKVIEKKDHITIVVGRQKAFARELEEIWNKSSSG
ncbi:probable lysophospholipase BODYGUARD 3 isoform X2 [Macadamia integrifolia]|uniref:probable lysophospholipase BODYGUARD 3 isoform X2 n=1 Tax=Macadamia integrifolia TaxID=60698 RepID=UPI001C5327FD|nr:probable lysophospholipase BODYGUARD 3 isoform X2 [Macadamia integrifolia]